MIKKIIFSFLSVFIFINKNIAQNTHQNLYQVYEQYKIKQIKHRRFKHKDIAALIKSFEDDANFEIIKLGQSYEGKDIYRIKLGRGDTRVLLWSQMHGDEATATMAIMDVLNFFQDASDFESFRDDILENLSIYFIPLLNPDGADRFQRRTALDIDLNRDALRTVTPEAKILKEAVMKLKPKFGFNLHDQSIYYSAGYHPKPATFSFLAPAYNYEKTVNEVRGNSMKLIVELNKLIQEYLPNQVAKYNDDFEPRAFGDNVQKWGTSTVLIESGGLKNDPEKQEMRKIHFVILLEALHAIATNSYSKNKIKDYYAIPENERLFFDVIIRRATFVDNNKKTTIDIGFRHHEANLAAGKYYNKPYIHDLGDLSIFYGYQDIDATGLTIVPGKLYAHSFKTFNKLKKKSLYKLINKGFTNVILDEFLPLDITTRLPITIQRKKQLNKDIRIGANPNFFLQKNGKTKFVIINGRAYTLKEIKKWKW